MGYDGKRWVLAGPNEAEREQLKKVWREWSANLPEGSAMVQARELDKRIHTLVDNDIKPVPGSATHTYLTDLGRQVTPDVLRTFQGLQADRFGERVLKLNPNVDARALTPPIEMLRDVMDIWAEASPNEQVRREAGTAAVVYAMAGIACEMGRPIDLRAQLGLGSGERSVVSGDTPILKAKAPVVRWG